MDIRMMRGAPAGGFRSALFDFDGTISLIRQGWQQVMTPYFTQVLLATPGAGSPEVERACAEAFITELTGKQTIYQCMALAEAVSARGGTPLAPAAYKEEYLRRLAQRTAGRIEGLRSGALTPQELEVPGAIAFLHALKARGLRLYLASGTDQADVEREAALLGVADLFAGIYGAREDLRLNDKAAVVQNILAHNRLSGHELLGFGDGYVEIECVAAAGGYAVGVASHEEARQGFDPWKLSRLAGVGAHAVIPDFNQGPELIRFLFAEGNAT